MESVRLDGKTVLVTGSNTGIGKPTAKGLAAAGARVILACRSEIKAEEARKDIVAETGNENVEVRKLDLSSLQSIRDFAQKYNQEESRLDILVCNAGQLNQDRQVTSDGFEQMFGVNHLGHFLLTNLLLDKLKASAPSRVVVVSSLAHENDPVDFDDLQSEKYTNTQAYGRSKSCNVLFAVQLAKVLKGTGVTTYSLHPGLVKSEIFRDLTFCSCCCECFKFCLLSCFTCLPAVTVDEGAQTSLYCCLEPSIAGDSGRYYSSSKEHPAKPHATDPERAEKLWNISAELCGLK